MVYVYAKKSQINSHLKKSLETEEIKQTLIDMGMDLKGESDEKDPELKIEITAEKMDLISPIGIARAINFYRGFETKLPNYKLEKAKEKVIVEKSANKARPKTVAAILQDVPMTTELLDEMIEIQEKIHDSFGRGRKKAAIGIYPIDKIQFPITFKAEDPKDIIFHPLEAQKEMSGHEILTQHDTGKKYAHLLEGLDFCPVFRDAKGEVLSMPPIINSHKTGKVTEKHKDLFIEISGHNITHLDSILKVLITTFIEMGAKAQAVKVEYEDGENYELSLEHEEDSISINYINSLIGTNLSKKEITALLPKVMFELKEEKDDKITIKIPCFRTDIWHDCDIADDIARAYGYNNITAKFPNISSIGKELNYTKFKDSFTKTLISMGYLETYTYILTSTTEQKEKMLLDSQKLDYIKITDSAEQGINMLRTKIIPELLRTLHINRKNKYPQHIFENGFTIQIDENTDTKARNEAHLSVAIAGPKSNYTQIKSVLDTITKLHELNIEVKESELSYFIQGRQAQIYMQNELIGEIGELHPQVINHFGLLVPIATLELNIDKIYELTQK